MITLCQICDKANVPHHIVDDVVDLLRDCKKNNINIQPAIVKESSFFETFGPSIQKSHSTIHYCWARGIF